MPDATSKERKNWDFLLDYKNSSDAKRKKIF